MNNSIVSFKLAKVLSKYGYGKENTEKYFSDRKYFFNEECTIDTYYTKSGNPISIYDRISRESFTHYYPAPDYVSVLGWLETRGIRMRIDVDGGMYSVQIYPMADRFLNRTDINWYKFYYDKKKLFKSRKEALEYGINKSLKLI